MDENNLKQDINNKAPERTMLMAQLLFREKPDAVSVSELQGVVGEIFGEIELVYDAPEAPFFALKNYRATFQKEEGKQYNHEVDNGDGTISLPVLLNFVIGAEFNTFDSGLDPLVKSQFWDFKGDYEGLKYHVSVFGMLSGSMYYKQEAELFLKGIEAALRCFPAAEAIYVPHSGKLTTVEYFREGMGFDLSGRFIRTAVNARFFRIEGSEDLVVDTLGFFAFGGADVQVHFHGLDPSNVVNYVYNIASYQFNADFPIKNGDTIDGLDESGQICQSVQWETQYENSLIQPVRAVLDINCGEYASGSRKQ